MPGGGPCQGNGGLTPGETWPDYDQLMLGGDDQLMHGGSFLNPAGGMQDWLDHLDVTDLFMGAESLGMNQPAVDFINSLGMNQADVDSPGMNQPAVDFVNSLGMSQAGVDSLGTSHVQVGAYPPAMGYSLPMAPAAGLNQFAARSSGLTQVSADSLGLTPTSAYPPAMGYLQPPAPAADVQQAVSDNEMMELAKMVRIAVECVDNTSTMWSEEEDQHLLHGLARLANENITTKCFNIANGLPKKTALDVAYRTRWLEKKKAVEQATLEPKKSEGMVTKGKGTKGAYKKYNKYPLSEEAPNFKSTKDLIRDNDRLMDHIEENLKTGQLEDTPEYLYYVKTNIDAIQKKISDEGNSMERLAIDQEAYEEVLRDHNSSAGKDATTP